MKKAVGIPYASSPEDVGVSSGLVDRFIEYVKEEELELHSLMVIRHGKVAVEWFNEPFSCQTKHSMYSISKSFTSTAIGFAIDEGLLSLDDVVVDFFPDYPPKIPNKNFKKLTVRHLLTMTAGKQTNVLADKGKIDWIGNYINSPWAFTPGDNFLYVNENIYMLCAILHRVAKMSIVEYLTPRLFEPLSIDIPFWETDQNGVEAGGWGLYLSTEDLAKLMLCYLNEGKFNGKQIIPKYWATQAVKNQIGDTKMPGNDKDCTAGYGYCFWINDTEPHSYRADGMFSQFGINFPELDASIITTAAIPDEALAREAVWRFFPKAFINEKIDLPRATEIKSSTLGTPSSAPRSSVEKQIQGRTIKVNKKILLNIVGLPMSVLPLAVTYMMSDKAGNINNIKFMFGEKECSMTWDEGDENNTVVCGMDGHYRYGTMTLGGIPFKVCCSAFWADEINLSVTVRPLETIGKRNLNFLFRRHNKVTITPSSTPSTYQICNSLVIGFEEVIRNPIICKLAQFFIKFAPPLAEPKHYGKFID
ncbi:MAG: serine hydrolase [Oscillospiraceae bacterium]